MVSETQGMGAGRATARGREGKEGSYPSCWIFQMAVRGDKMLLKRNKKAQAEGKKMCKGVGGEREPGKSAGGAGAVGGRMGKRAW